jgi:glycerol-3-phosphate acyltransferase PlsX
LSVGEEESKGNELTREAHQLLKTAPVRFVGNVEGRDVYSGEADVIVCDGFTGNITLKISEGLVETVERLLHEELSATVGTRVGYLLSREAFRRFRKRVDYAEYGGAPLIGLDGLCVIGHGRSSAKAVRSAVMMTAKLVNEQLLDRLTQEVAAVGCEPRPFDKAQGRPEPVEGRTVNGEPRAATPEPRTPNREHA